MTQKEMKKLKRTELLEMLIEQKKLNDELSAKLEEAQQKLENRNVAMQDVGSIAEASLKLSGIFEAAQKAADIYLENVKAVSGVEETVPENADGVTENQETEKEQV